MMPLSDQIFVLWQQKCFVYMLQSNSVPVVRAMLFFSTLCLLRTHYIKVFVKVIFFLGKIINMVYSSSLCNGIEKSSSKPPLLGFPTRDLGSSSFVSAPITSTCYGGRCAGLKPSWAVCVYQHTLPPALCSQELWANGFCCSQPSF